MLLELFMSLTMEQVRAVPARAPQGATSGSRDAQVVPSVRADAIEVAACRKAILEECARPGATLHALEQRLSGVGFPALAPTWQLVWTLDHDNTLAGAFAASGIEPLDLLERLTLATPGHLVRRLMEARIVSEAPAEELTWILEHLAEHGAWREVDLALSISAVDVVWLGLDPAQVDAEVVVALQRMLARDTKGFGSLRSLVKESPEDFAEVGIEALSGTTGERALATLAYLLDDNRLDTIALVRAVEQVGRRSLPPFDEFLLRRLRELSQDDDIELRAASLRASGALADERSLDLQIAGISDEEAIVRSAAGDALNELTGLRFGTSPERWLSWYASENAWWDERAQTVLDRLEDVDPAVAISAIGELIPHRMQRARLASAIARCLDNESPELRRLACLGIEQLGSRTVVLDVLERLTDVDEDVRESAHHCLQAFFQVELPPEPESWVALLERSDVALR